MADAPAVPSWRVHMASHALTTAAVHFLLLNRARPESASRSQGPIWVWLGTTTAEFSQLVLSLPALHSACTTQLLGDPLSDHSHRLSARLAQRFQVPVYVSYNIPSGFHHEHDVAIERALVRELQQFLKTSSSGVGALQTQR